MIRVLGMKLPAYKKLLDHTRDVAIVRVLQLKTELLTIAEIARSMEISRDTRLGQAEVVNTE